MSLLTETSSTPAATTGTTETAAQMTGTTSTTPPPAAGQSSWIDTLPDDLKSNGSLRSFNDVASLAKSYVHAQEMIGKKGTILPTEKSPQEEWDKFYDGLGRPTLDKYEVKLKDGVEFDENTVKGFKEVAHKMGILPKQAQSILDFYVKNEEDSMAASIKEVQAEATEQLSNLKKEWGQGYEKQVAFAKLAVKELGGDDLVKYLAETGLGNDVQIIKLMAKAGALLGEDKLRGDGSGKFGMTPAEINKQISQIMGDRSHAYYDASNPAHKSAVAQMEELYKAKSG